MRKEPLFIGSVILCAGWMLSFAITGDLMPAISLGTGAVVLFWMGMGAE